jgi:putative membrane protein
LSTTSSGWSPKKKQKKTTNNRLSGYLGKRIERMNNQLQPQISQKVKPWIWVVSIAVPLVVALLLNPAIEKIDLGFNTYIFPRINASINSVVSILLLVGLVLIKQKNITRHKQVMITAFGLSALFLVSYVLYHVSTPRTDFCDLSPVGQTFYRIILFSHIILSVFIIPLASFAIFHGLRVDYEKHKRLVKFTWPLWFYVSVTGVLVYFFISPCYPPGV